MSSSLTPESKLSVFRRATALLAASTSFDETMAHTIAAFLPVLGDFGFFDLDVGERVCRTARAHEDPRVENILRPTTWIRQERTDMNLCALSTGRPALHAVIDDAWYRAIAVNEGHLQVLRDLAFVSMISVPMRYQGELLGAMTLFHGRSGRHYDESDLAFAIDLAGLAAPVVANARLLEQQRKTTEALRTSEERLRVGMDAGKLGVWDWDIVNDHVTWSDRIYDLHGISRERFGGTVAGFAGLVHADDRERIQGAIEAALADDAPYQVEFRAPLPDGSIRWLATTARVYRGPDGAPIRMIGASHDITERRELLEAAREANRAKDDFLAMLGHELRNPLAPIVTALDLMDANDRAPFRRERDIIARQVTQMSRLVDDLLDIARIARGKLEVTHERVDLVVLVERSIEAQRHGAVAIEIEAGTRPLHVDGDPVRLLQIVNNLVSNAIKFSPPGERVTISIAPADGGVELAVRDRGSGIDPDLLPHVFDMFVQGPQALARERGGLGVGLAIVANLVDLHGGTIRLDNEPGRGTAFRVLLPGARDSQRVVSPPAPLPATGPLRVLVVDDNPDAAETLGELLRLHGHDARVAGNAQEALATLLDHAPHVAVLDIGLPDVDGYELARLVRDRAPETRLIAVTGYGLESDRARARDAGFDDHLVKPVEVAVLMQRIAAIAESR